MKRAGDVFGEDSPWFLFQAENLHLLDPGMLDTVLAGPETLLEGYDGERLLPAISCPVLILQADPTRGGMPDEDVEAALRLLPRGHHVRLEGIGHELHGPPGQEQEVLRAITPFLERL
jgi:pimeloyl-ACP methyl ester carboxylesterase